MWGKKKSVDCAWLKTKVKTRLPLWPIRYQRLLSRRPEKGGSMVKCISNTKVLSTRLETQRKNAAPEKEEQRLKRQSKLPTRWLEWEARSTRNSHGSRGLPPAASQRQNGAESAKCGRPCSPCHGTSQKPVSFSWPATRLFGIRLQWSASDGVGPPKQHKGLCAWRDVGWDVMDGMSWLALLGITGSPATWSWPASDLHLAAGAMLWRIAISCAMTTIAISHILRRAWRATKWNTFQSSNNRWLFGSGGTWNLPLIWQESCTGCCQQRKGHTPWQFLLAMRRLLQLDNYDLPLVSFTRSGTFLRAHHVELPQCRGCPSTCSYLCSAGVSWVPPSW